jgi:hypothetical protein
LAPMHIQLTKVSAAASSEHARWRREPSVRATTHTCVLAGTDGSFPVVNTASPRRDAGAFSTAATAPVKLAVNAAEVAKEAEKEPEKELEKEPENAGAENGAAPKPSTLLLVVLLNAAANGEDAGMNDGVVDESAEDDAASIGAVAAATAPPAAAANAGAATVTDGEGVGTDWPALAASFTACAGGASSTHATSA